MLRQKDQLYEVDPKDKIKMDEWLHAIPDPITEEDLPDFGTEYSELFE